MTKQPRIYSYTGCGTCKKALRWLKDRGIAGELIAIRECPPTKRELRLAIEQVPTLRALFNTSGGDYKALSLKDRIGTMSPEEAIELLSTNGNLVKRPFIVLSSDQVLVGFDQTAFAEAFG